MEEQFDFDEVLKEFRSGKKLYMGIQNATKKWNMPMWNWNLTLSQLAIFFEGRLEDELKI